MHKDKASIIDFMMNTQKQQSSSQSDETAKTFGIPIHQPRNGIQTVHNARTTHTNDLSSH